MSTPLFKRLANGLPVLSVPMAGTESATVLVIVSVGSRYETKTEHGISHVLEHMLFKGSAKWPTAKELSQTLDGVGADYNAFTAKDHTGYYVRVAARHLPLAIDVVSDMIWHPILDPAELKREKKVICEEIKMYEDNPLMHIGDLYESAVFQGSSLGVNIAGSLKSVTSLTPAQVSNFHKQHYTSDKLLVVVAGKITAATAKLLAEKFSLKRSGAKARLAKFKLSQTKPRVVIQKKDTQQVQLALGFPAYGYRHPNRLGLELLALVLGGNMSSRLFMRLREQEGLCYSISAAAEEYEGVGTFAVQAGLDTSRLHMAIKLIREELTKTVKAAVTPDELKKAKEYIKGKLILAMENSSARAQWTAKQYLFEHKRESLTEFIGQVNKITVSDLHQAAKDVINFRRANLALIGPFSRPRRWQKLIEP